MGALTYSSTVVDLPDDMTWANEFTWRAVEQKKQYSITGALLVESALKATGRPIELRADQQVAWITRADVLALYALVKQPGIVMALEFRGETFSVIFDHEGGAIEAAPLREFADPTDDDFFIVTLRFVEVLVS